MTGRTLIASVYAYRGERDRAFRMAGKARGAKGHRPTSIADEPIFKILHDDPRWLPFLRKLGKAPEQLAAIKFELKVPQHYVQQLLARPFETLTKR